MSEVPIHVALVMAGDEEGGLEKHVIDLACELLNYDIRTTVIAHPKYGSRLRKGVGFVAAPLHLGRRNPRTLWALLSALRKLQPTVIHTQAHKATAMVHTIHRWLPPIPRVGTVHNLKQRYDMFACCQVVIGVSRGVANHTGLSQARVIYNGCQVPDSPSLLDAAAFREKLGFPLDRPLWLGIGRLVPAKAFDVLLDSWARLLDAPSLMIAGDGPEQSRLQRQLACLGLQDRVRLLGHRTDISTLLAACDGIVISSHREGFSYVMAEGLLARRPVLATRVPGPAEILPETCLTDPGNAEALAAMLQFNLADPSALQARFASVWVWAREHLTLTGMATRYADLYRELVGIS
uniref:Glycosyltransferase involved in cell wall bisynthesis n=1 Tax=Candidatus Kentrum sp. TUN TaxID=2126343 RepID=A0A451AHY1_9GAMM|nr:MAG: Glycosyltransferase involved in cell wall bisynthesis [Candidatus Kentron sp. TUN]VFK56739.1 MAG: Glycosyltransferase involved in cell wall bisynthesis [Candidatus Kentron sp. TUN]VFK65648.1 MAG: Glycosyltransferase involved in cell wall bisynthesis [Candidatus Kentron sp. TUN]